MRSLALQRRQLGRQGEALIDGSKGNKVYENFAKREFEELMEAIGIEGFTPYDCRHTFTARAIRAGVDKLDLTNAVCNKSATKEKVAKLSMLKSS